MVWLIFFLLFPIIMQIRGAFGVKSGDYIRFGSVVRPVRKACEVD